MNLDKEQKNAVSCRKNAVIAAGAGAGKTRVLTERYLSLLGEKGTGVANILALTFTRKAAGEMYERIYRGIAESANPCVHAHLDNFEDATITTLDSFCRTICVNSIHNYGFPQDFRLDDKLFREQAGQDALDFFLEHGDNPVLQNFIAMTGFESCLDDLLVDLAVKDIVLPAGRDLAREAEAQLAEHERRYAAIPTDLAKSLDQILALDSSLKSVLDKKDQAALYREKISGIKTPSGFAGFLADKSVKFTKPGGRSNDPAFCTLKEIIDVVNDQLNGLYESASLLAAADEYREMYRLLALWQDRVFALKRRQSLLCFSDLVSISIDILKQDLELRAFYKKKFRYIMIDEFQDNNRQQKELLYLLAEEDSECRPGIPAADRLDRKKLFFVGDEKQSIYKFRGADVSVFKELQDEIRAVGGECIRLETNYRSEPGLIDFFNELFPSVMENAGENYEASFGALKSRAADPKVRPLIGLFKKPYDPDCIPDSEMLGNDEAEAFTIAKYIVNAVAGKQLSLTGGKPAEYSDFVILMRSTGNQQLYERILRRFAIPFSTVSTRSLFLDAPASDLYSVLQAALNPADRLAAAAFLRSPYAGLNDRSITALLTGCEGDLFAPEAAAPVDDGQRELYAQAAALLDALRAMIDVRPLTEVLDFLWYEQGYRYHILSRPAVHNFSEFHEYLRRIAFSYDNEGKPCIEFLGFLRDNLGSYEKLEDQELERKTGGVQIMTVHAAKGLEFPVVILANCGNKGRSNQTRPYYISSEWGLTLNLLENKRDGGRFLNSFFSEGKEENDRKERAELKRLLYVGCTRAEQHLIISGCENRTNRTEGKTMLNMVEAALEARPKAEAMITRTEIPAVSRKQFWSRAASEQKRSPVQMLALYRENGEQALRIAARRFSASELEELAGEKGPLLFSCAGLACDDLLGTRNLETAFGSLCHRIIETGLHTRAGASAGLTPADFPEIYQFAADGRERVFAEAARLARRFFASESGKRALAAKQLFSEKGFLYTPDKQTIISGVSDLWFSDAAGDVLIDFKSDRKAYGGAYRVQFTIYAYAWKALSGNMPECYLFYLRDGRAVKVEPFSEQELGRKVRSCRYEEKK
ncbi:MAG: UvrD-helicase domain-containing protein [Spirochaetales bacterium]|nr:UvrD-helicase domain-containing protein [Spirochaetales bacterium]